MKAQKGFRPGEQMDREVADLRARWGTTTYVETVRVAVHAAWTQEKGETTMDEQEQERADDLAEFEEFASWLADDARIVYEGEYWGTDRYETTVAGLRAQLREMGASSEGFRVLRHPFELVDGGGNVVVREA